MENIKKIIKEYAENKYAARLGSHYGDYGEFIGIWSLGFDHYKDEDDDEKIDTNEAIRNLFERVIELEEIVIKLNDELNKGKCLSGFKTDETKKNTN